MDESLFRVANASLSLLVAGTLCWRHWYYRHRNSVDNRLRSLTSVLVFAWIAVSSGVALERDLELPFTVKIATGFLAAYLLALWTPWRWRRPRPRTPA